jgi:hypothetical protein
LLWRTQIARCVYRVLQTAASNTITKLKQSYIPLSTSCDPALLQYSKSRVYWQRRLILIDNVQQTFKKKSCSPCERQQLLPAGDATVVLRLEQYIIHTVRVASININYHLVLLYVALYSFTF